MSVVVLDHRPYSWTGSTTVQGFTVPADAQAIILTVAGDLTTAGWSYAATDGGSLDATYREVVQPGQWVMPRNPDVGPVAAWACGVAAVAGTPTLTVRAVTELPCDA